MGIRDRRHQQTERTPVTCSQTKLDDPDDLAEWINERFLSAKAAKHAAVFHRQVGVSPEPVEELASEEPLADELEDTYLPGVNTDAIELGLRLAAQLGA
jgi:hypothetical protein